MSDTAIILASVIGANILEAGAIVLLVMREGWFRQQIRQAEQHNRTHNYLEQARILYPYESTDIERLDCLWQARYNEARLLAQSGIPSSGIGVELQQIHELRTRLFNAEDVRNSATVGVVASVDTTSPIAQHDLERFLCR